MTYRRLTFSTLILCESVQPPRAAAPRPVQPCVGPALLPRAAGPDRIVLGRRARGGFLVAGALRWFIVQHFTFFVNSVAHGEVHGATDAHAFDQGAHGIGPRMSLLVTFLLARRGLARLPPSLPVGLCGGGARRATPVQPHESVHRLVLSPWALLRPSTLPRRQSARAAQPALALGGERDSEGPRRLGRRRHRTDQAPRRRRDGAARGPI